MKTYTFENEGIHYVSVPEDMAREVLGARFDSVEPDDEATAALLDANDPLNDPEVPGLDS